MPSPTSAVPPTPVLLFDGDCGLCNRVVRRLLIMDRNGRLRFAPLQGPAAQDFLTAHGLPTKDFSTLVYVPDWAHRDRPDFRVRTDGVIAALRECGGRGRFAAAGLRLCPRALRDWAYRRIARLRHRLFDAERSSPLPRPEWPGRFLD